MTDRWSRLSSLTGVAFAALTVAAIFSGGETPDATATPAKVIAYYGTHRSEVETSSILFALAFLLVVLFAGALRSYVRPAAEGLAALILAGAVMMSIGATIGAGLEYALAKQLPHLGPQTAQALNVITNEIFLPVIAGAFIFALSAGLAILRSAVLPKWLGWVAIVLAIVVIVPPTSFPALLGFVIWSVIVSILMYVRSGVSADTPADTSAPTPQPAL
jgi:hypothetical protein